MKEKSDEVQEDTFWITADKKEKHGEVYTQSYIN